MGALILILGVIAVLMAALVVRVSRLVDAQRDSTRDICDALAGVAEALHDHHPVSLGMAALARITDRETSSQGSRS